MERESSTKMKKNKNLRFVKKEEKRKSVTRSATKKY